MINKDTEIDACNVCPKIPMILTDLKIEIRPKQTMLKQANLYIDV